MTNQTKNFYENMPLETLDIYSKKSGLFTFPEITVPQFRNEIQKSSSIIELGAGRGRVIDGLIRNNYRKPIIGVERSNNHFNFLQEKYRKKSQVKIIQKDITLQELPFADLGLLLWAEICNLEIAEQENLIQKLSNSVNCLIIDNLIVGQQSNATNTNGNKYEFQMPWGTIKGIIAEPEMFKEWALSCFSEFEQIDYKTKNQKLRRMYIMKN